MYKQLCFTRIIVHTNNLVMFVHTECYFEDKRPTKYLMPTNRFIYGGVVPNSFVFECYNDM